jgi:hypothetical protein
VDGQKIDVLVAIAADTILNATLTGLHRHPVRRSIAIAVTRPAAAGVDGIDLRRTDLTGIEIDRARETVCFIPVIAAPDVQHAHHPVVAAGVIIQGRRSKRNVSGMEPVEGLLLNSLLADPNRLVAGKPLTFPLVPAIVHSTPALSIEITAVSAAAPGEIEGVAFRTAIGVLNSNDCGSTALRTANQFLAAAPIHACKPEVRGVTRYATGAFEPAPLRGLPGKIPECRIVSADLHLCGPVDHHFDRALAPVGTATPIDLGSTLHGLAACGSGNRGKSRHPDCE